MLSIQRLFSHSLANFFLKQNKKHRTARDTARLDEESDWRGTLSN